MQCPLQIEQLYFGYRTISDMYDKQNKIVIFGRDVRYFWLFRTQRG